ncbi:hypothetical protein [Enterococcus cecorum]|uniref:hypothetical protein n=1 Tax=Enterococcus cecorum TaxID=44008 RepID=UPI00148CC48F|nr:hypothetical protein [Enterococcus cecorum]CAI3375767.1 hypothetical protein CIRMBP1304_00743 [Enterococcus cecorum]
MIKGITKSGFRFKVNESIINDYEFLELISEVEENPIMFPKLLNRLLGKQQTEKLKNHVRDKNGIVDAEKITAEVADIFKTQKQLKK